MIYFILFTLLYPALSLIPLLIFDRVGIEIDDKALNIFFFVNFLLYCVIGTLIYINDFLKSI